MKEQQQIPPTTQAPLIPQGVEGNMTMALGSHRRLRPSVHVLNGTLCSLFPSARTGAQHGLVPLNVNEAESWTNSQQKKVMCACHYVGIHCGGRMTSRCPRRFERTTGFPNVENRYEVYESLFFLRKGKRGAQKAAAATKTMCELFL